MQMSKNAIEAGERGVREYFRSLSVSADAERAHHCGAIGPVAALEEKLRTFYGVRYALCVSNATTGLLALALAAGLRRNEFVTTPFTYGATLAGWLLLDNRPLFADIDAQTLTITSDSVSRVLTPKTKAILAVDIFGNPSDSLGLRQIADRHGIWYFADASQSLGATRQGLAASALADALVVSFTANKPVGAGEGGAVLTNNKALYQKLVWATQHPSRQRRELGLQLDNEFALNGRISPTSAAWAASAFEPQLQNLKKRQKRCLRIIRELNDIGLTVPIDFDKDEIVPSFFRLTAEWNGRAREKELIDNLNRRSFRVNLACCPIRIIYKQSAFRTQYPTFAKKAHRCRNAETQAIKRFSIV